MLRLRIKAPFAAFRYFTGGSFRPTAPFVTPSAAYGLLLNLAGLESRLYDDRFPMTLVRKELPKFEIALGAIVFPELQSIYQQLHNYPVGSSGKDHAPDCKGTKYNIQPVRRQFLSNIDIYVCGRKNEDFIELVRDGLSCRRESGSNRDSRYGLPFLGDNNFMVDTVREETNDSPAYWYVRVNSGESNFANKQCRLTVWVDRLDNSRTVSMLYSPTPERLQQPPENAWTWVGPPSAL